MKLVSYLNDGQDQLAILVDGMLYNTDELHPDLPSSMGMFLNYWDDAYPNALVADQAIKEKRFQTLMKTQKKMVKKRNAQFVGKKLPVIVEGYHPESKFLMVGRTTGQCPEIDGIVIINDGRKVSAFGEIYNVEISECSGYDLIGKVL